MHHIIFIANITELESIRNMNVWENMKIKNLSSFACSYENGKRLKEEEEDFRPSFFRDIDRIIYSLAYTRYLDKTQVFTHGKNDHLSRRMTHVQFVSKIARTIGRSLNLNEDLIEAASLGHDLGHTPFGHVGEVILNKISLENNAGYFNHNIQSVRLLMEVENYGKGYNITIQVLDAIMCHNGEIPLGIYEPCKKSVEEFLKEYQNSYEDKELNRNLVPMTLEGCVVRISDIISYVGKDVEDAIRLKIIKNTDLPKEVVEVLGKTNKEIVNTIIKDVIINSLGKNYIKISDRIYNAIKKLMDFNYKNIYYKSVTEKEKQHIEKVFRLVFENLLEDLENKNKASIIYEQYLDKMSDDYKNKNSNVRIVIDYIAGMTDDFILKQYENLKK